MSSQEKLAGVALQKNDNWEEKSVALLEQIQERSLFARTRKLHKLALGKTYEVLDQDGTPVGVIETVDRGVALNGVVSAWVQYVDPDNQGRHQKLLYAPGLQLWFNTTTKLCCGGNCVNLNHYSGDPGFKVVRQRVYSPVVRRVRIIRGKAEGVALQVADRLAKKALRVLFSF